MLGANHLLPEALSRRKKNSGSHTCLQITTNKNGRKKTYNSEEKEQTIAANLSRANHLLEEVPERKKSCALTTNSSRCKPFVLEALSERKKNGGSHTCLQIEKQELPTRIEKENP
ncbi:9053_t:CDS:2 [Racocetra persica]|uniref:9053_t:CDS:1 n=1 Tax=Racocetra persica TaxID=160502 RepID=A0ACA9M2Y3_9GLOM|nr:9053_t:CDS:2 [Racocetra persica]